MSSSPQPSPARAFLPGRGRLQCAALLACAALIVLGVGVLASVTFSEHDLDGTWNVITLSQEGFGFGEAELEDGEHEGGSDHVLKTESGATDTGYAGVFAKFFKEYELFSDGWFFGEAHHEEGESHDDEGGHGAYGILARLGSAASFFGINTAEEEEEDGHGHGLGFRALAEEHEDHHDISTFFAAVKRHSLDTPAMLGAPTVSRFVGAYLAIDHEETTARHGFLAFRRSFDSGLHLLNYDLAASTLTQRAGTVDGNSGTGGVAIARADLAASVRSGIAAGSFTDTAAVYRFAFDAETSLALVVRDTAPTAALRNFAGAAVRAKSPLTVSDVSGIWQMALVLPEDEAFHGSFATLDLVGDGTGDYDNGEEEEFHAGPIAWSLGTQTLGGATSGDSVVVLELKPEEDADTVTIHAFVSVDSRYLVAAGTSAGLFGLGAKRPNSVVADLAFNVEKEVLDQDSTEVFMKVQPGATAGAPRMHFSLMGSQNRLIKGFSSLRDSGISGSGITRILSAIQVTPETRVMNPESIVMTINLKNLSSSGASGAGARSLTARALGAIGLGGEHDHGGSSGGSSSSAGSTGPSSRLVPLVFDETKKRWELVPEANVVSRTETSISFRPPHFSAIGVASVAGSQNPEVKACAATLVLGRGPGAATLPGLRALRERILGFGPGRFLVDVYHAWGTTLLALVACFAFVALGIAQRLRRRRTVLVRTLSVTITATIAVAVLASATPSSAQAPEPDDDATPATTATTRDNATAAAAPARSRLLPDVGLTIDGVIEKRERAADFANIRSAELMVGSSVDPYFDLYANILMTPDEIALEEAYATVHFSSLIPSVPILGALQGRFGKMLIPFGHLGGIHPHAFPQVDAPLIIREFFGGEAPNQIGGWVEYVVPWYDNPSLTLLAGAYNGDYGRAFDGTRGHGPLWLGRVTTFTEWGEGRHALRVSGSLLDDRNDTTSGLHSRIWSLEGKYRHALSERGRQILVGAEYLRHERDENARTLNKVNGGRDLTTEGAYAWGQYDHNIRWGVGYRFDRTHPLLSARNRYDAHSPYLEYRPSEFSKLRLQWRREDPVYGEKETRIMLQGVWSIGWHPAHKF